VQLHVIKIETYLHVTRWKKAKRKRQQRRRNELREIAELLCTGAIDAGSQAFF
jgi:hypothetical protein